MNKYLKKTLKGILEIIREELLGEEYSSGNGFLHEINPGIKLLSMLIILLSLSFIHKIEVLLLANIFILALARTAGFKFLFFIKRAWLVVPLFTAVMSLPSLFNVVVPGKALYTFFHLTSSNKIFFIKLPADLYITMQGTKSAAILILRVGASVSLSLLLILSTRWNSMLKSLRIIRIPQFMVMIIQMSYRYIFLLMNISQEIFEARHLRTIGQIPAHENRSFMASSIGNIFLKTTHYSEEVYASMIARGYTGEIYLLDDRKPRLTDYIHLIAAVIFSIGLILI